MDKRVPENDYCDLEPGKICDNCCRCIDEPGKEYNTVLADFELLEEDYVLDLSLIHISEPTRPY